MEKGEFLKRLHIPTPPHFEKLHPGHWVQACKESASVGYDVGEASGKVQGCFYVLIPVVAALVFAVVFGWVAKPRTYR